MGLVLKSERCLRSADCELKLRSHRREVRRERKEISRNESREGTRLCKMSGVSPKKFEKAREVRYLKKTLWEVGRKRSSNVDVFLAFLGPSAPIEWKRPVGWRIIVCIVAELEACDRWTVEILARVHWRNRLIGNRLEN